MAKGANIAVDTAIELARLTGAALYVVHARKVVSTYQMAAEAETGVVPINVTESTDAVLEEGRRTCDEVVKRAEHVGVHAEGHCVGGDPSDALIRVAEDVKADLIVVGNRGMTGKRRFALGSVPNKVSHHCPASLLIVDTSRVRM
jgi:nucleotide-binding universal stress UspA family protein